jgi:hypothetical protein
VKLTKEEYMKVTICRTGTIVHIPKDVMSQVLIEAGLVAPLHDAPHQIGPAQTTWSVGESTQSGEPNVSVRCDTCRNADIIFSPNEKVHFSHCGVSEPIPADVLKRYREARNSFHPA